MTDSVEHDLQDESLALSAGPLALRRLFYYGLGFILAGVISMAASWWWQFDNHADRLSSLAQTELASSQIQNELLALNQVNASVPEPRGLATLVNLARQITRGELNYGGFGSLYQQRVQALLTQAIEVLSRPIGGLDSELERRTARESLIRLEGLQRLERLQVQLNTGSVGMSWIGAGIGLSLLTLGLLLIHTAWQRQITSGLKRRINSLSRAIRTQQDADLKMLGAKQALGGIKTLLENTRDESDRELLLQMTKQLEELKESGPSVLQFANAFHQLSTHATRLARHALTNEQRMQKADGYTDMMKDQLDGLREDMRTAAQGLRKAGQISRQLLKSLQNPEQMELDMNDPSFNLNLQDLVENSQHALKEAIEGLVLASQKINMGQFEANKLAEHLAVNHTAWSNLLEEIEQQAESASRESAKALALAQTLIHNTKQVQPDKKTITKTLPIPQKS